MFRFTHDFWTIPSANMTFTRSQQNYTTSVLVGEHEVQTFEVVVVVVVVMDEFSSSVQSLD